MREAALDAGQKQQQFTKQHCGGDHQTQHVRWRSPLPLVAFWKQELVPTIQVGVECAEEQRQRPQLRLEARDQSEKEREERTDQAH